MTASNVAATKAVAYAFLDAHFPWLPKPEITEWDNINSGGQYYATAHSIAVPKYSDAWNDGNPETVIHECGHVLAFYLGEHGVPVVERFLATFGVPTFTHPLINEVFAEHFARAYSDGYTGKNYPQLVGLIPFDAAKMRAFAEALRPTVVVPPTVVVAPAPAARTMYDSTNPYDIPVDARMVAGYIDGWYRWPDDSWDRFPYAVKVRIAIHPTTKGAHVLDVEWGAAAPEDVPGWVAMSRADGIDPSVYVNRSNWQACKDACDAAGVAYPHWWVAAYGIGQVLLDGTVATQYANEAITGHHYDLSIVAPVWPGVEGDEMDRDTFNAWFLEQYKALGVAATFDAIKEIQAEQENRLNTKADATHGHTATTTVK